METTTSMNPYAPYTEMEFNELKAIVDGITTHIPNDKMGFIWNNYKKITNSNEAQPCSCGSAAGHWRRAVDEIRNFITQVQS